MISTEPSSNYRNEIIKVTVRSKIYLNQLCSGTNYYLSDDKEGEEPEDDQSEDDQSEDNEARKWTIS
ncbi:MAG: hypothetical protein P0116_12840 [Candidatus Nitrosocosmicus sp.]|nr:hypothetical protein [Candidatus Nitrosocosmicus sp.]